MSDLFQPSTKQQIQMLREMTRLTGGLHEAQVLQLKMWPMVLFTGLISHEFTWDETLKEVSFVLTGKRPPLKVVQAAVEVLNSWVQELLGESWIVRVKWGKNSFAGKRSIINVGKRPDSD